MIDKKRNVNPLGGILIHASAVRIGSAAVIFLGPPGAGKSTICHLLRPYAYPLADDRVYLAPRADGMWGVFDGGGRLVHQRLSDQELDSYGGPVLRIVSCLHHAPLPRLERVSALKTCRWLTDASFQVLGRARTKMWGRSALFAGLANVARSTPGYDLYFGLSSESQIFRMIKRQLPSN
jgi:hypothetical protein